MCEKKKSRSQQPSDCISWKMFFFILKNLNYNLFLSPVDRFDLMYFCIPEFGPFCLRNYFYYYYLMFFFLPFRLKFIFLVNIYVKR